MSRVIFIALLIAVAIYGSNGHDSKEDDYVYLSPKDCVGPHKVWDENGTLCPLKCGESEIRLCPPRRFATCACKRGYYETATGDCVLPEDCP